MSEALILDLKTVLTEHMDEVDGWQATADLHLISIEWLVASAMLFGVPADDIGASFARALEAVRRTQN